MLDGTREALGADAPIRADVTVCSWWAGSEEQRSNLTRARRPWSLTYRVGGYSIEPSSVRRQGVGRGDDQQQGAAGADQHPGDGDDLRLMRASGRTDALQKG